MNLGNKHGIVLDSCNSHGCEWRLKDAPSDRRCNAINATPVENADLRRSCFRRCAQVIIPARRRTRPQFRGFFHSSCPSCSHRGQAGLHRVYSPALALGTVPRIVSLGHVKILGLQLVSALSDTRYWNLPQPKALRC